MAPGEESGRIAELTTLLDVSRQLGATTELNPLLEQITAAACRVLNCERATIFLYDRARHELYSRVATGAKEIRFSADLGIAGQCARDKAIINVPDAYADERFNREIDRKTGYLTRNLLTFPLDGHNGQLVGVLQVLNKRTGPFTSHDENLSSTLSSLAGVAIQRQMLLDEYAEKRKLERDLALARRIQQTMLPKEQPQVLGFDIAGFNQAADATGGDCYDFIKLRDGLVGLLIADATGHGIGPALLVSQFRAVLRALSMVEVDPAEVLRGCNNLLYSDIPDGMFITSFFGVVSPGSPTVRFFSAGQGPLLVYRRATDQCDELPADTVPLGVLNPMEPEPPTCIELKSEDVLILITDGYHEACSASGEPYGTEPIIDIVRQNRSASAAQLVDLINEALAAFAAGTTQADDLTAIVVRKL